MQFAMPVFGRAGWGLMLPECSLVGAVEACSSARRLLSGDMERAGRVKPRSPGGVVRQHEGLMRPVRSMHPGAGGGGPSSRVSGL